MLNFSVSFSTDHTAAPCPSILSPDLPISPPILFSVPSAIWSILLFPGSQIRAARLFAWTTALHDVRTTTVRRAPGPALSSSTGVTALSVTRVLAAEPDRCKGKEHSSCAEPPSFQGREDTHCLQLPSSPRTLAPPTRSLHFLRSDLCSHLPRQEGLTVTLTRQSTRRKPSSFLSLKLSFSFCLTCSPLRSTLCSAFSFPTPAGVGTPAPLAAVTSPRVPHKSFCTPPCESSQNLCSSCLSSEQKLSLTPKCLPDGQFLCLITYRNVISFITLSRNIILSAITFLMRHLRASHLICSQSIFSDKYSVV